MFHKENPIKIYKGESTLHNGHTPTTFGGKKKTEHKICTGYVMK